MSTSAAPADLSRYAWADYLDCMEGLPEPMVLHSPSEARRGPSLVWGLLATAAVTAAAFWISDLPFAPFTLKGNRHPVESVMTAIILGMIAANLLPLPKLLQPGLRFTTKKLLPLAIILLGARLDFVNDVVRVGREALWMSVATIVFGLSLFLLCVRLGWVSRNLGLLLGVGTSICGATAVVAAAPIIDADEKDVTFSVATVTICGLLAMFLLPALAPVFHLSNRAFGVWAGLSIHAMPQVLAAGFAYSQPAGDTATIVKLARVCLLAPVLLVVGWQAARAGHAAGRRVRLLNVFPIFVFGFLAMAMLRTTALLPDLTIRLSRDAAVGAGAHEVSLARLCEAVSRYLIVAAMAAVGLETRFNALKKTGLRPLLLGLSASVVLAAAVLAAIKAMGM